jgi:hypothetical protein
MAVGIYNASVYAEVPMTGWRLLVVLGCLLAGAANPQPGISAYQQHDGIEFEDDWVRVLRISVGPGEKTAVRDYADGVLVFLTADLDGQMPPTDAVWQPAGSRAVENRAKTRFEALFVELKVAPSDIPAPRVPELALGTLTNADAYSYDYRRDHRVTSLIDNERVTVSRHRLVPLLRTEQFHFHPREAVLVYLRGGALSGSTALYGFQRARRGEFDVLPANTFHDLRNMGNDPIEFLVVWPK